MLLKNNPSWVETYYSQLVYPFIFDTHRLFFEKFSFSVGDLLYAFLVLFIAKNVTSIFKKKENVMERNHKPQLILRIIGFTTFQFKLGTELLSHSAIPRFGISNEVQRN